MFDIMSVGVKCFFLSHYCFVFPLLLQNDHKMRNAFQSVTLVAQKKNSEYSQQESNIRPSDYQSRCIIRYQILLTQHCAKPHNYRHCSPSSGQFIVSQRQSIWTQLPEGNRFDSYQVSVPQFFSFKPPTSIFLIYSPGSKLATISSLSLHNHKIIPRTFNRLTRSVNDMSQTNMVFP